MEFLAVARDGWEPSNSNLDIMNERNNTVDKPLGTFKFQP